MQVTQTRIQPVGRYVPSRPAAPAPSHYQRPGMLSPQAKGFFQDVWVGAKGQLKDHGNRVLNPIDTVKRGLDTTPRQLWNRTLAPYKQAFRAGRPGQALGRLLANVVVVGGAILGGRALLSRGLPSLGGGGASVGMRGPVGAAFDAVSGFVGGITRSVGKVFTGALGVVGNGVRWLIGGGGGASIGFR